MSEYVQFLAAHWLLSAAFVIVLVLLIGNELFARSRAAEQCSPQKLVQMINHDNITIVDVRDKTDYRAGKIVGAKNIPADELMKRVSDLDKTKPIVLVCSNGQQTSKLAHQLKEQGYNASYLAGGIAAWRSDNMPLDK
ncbi:MAG: rhodanese-like domain-containing protein [Gammaproteobacteria bacterium]